MGMYVLTRIKLRKLSIRDGKVEVYAAGMYMYVLLHPHDHDPLWNHGFVVGCTRFPAGSGLWPQSATLSENTETETLESRLAEPLAARSMAMEDSSDRVRVRATRRCLPARNTHAAASTAATTPATTTMATTFALPPIPALFPVPSRRGQDGPEATALPSAPSSLPWLVQGTDWDEWEATPRDPDRVWFDLERKI